MKILMIDSEYGRAKAIAELLRHSGHKDVFLAFDEIETMQCLKNNVIDIIIFEPMMPEDRLMKPSRFVPDRDYGGVGFVLLQNIHDTLADAPHQPTIIFRTILTKEEAISGGFPKDAMHFTKPVSYKVLDEAIRKLSTVTV